MSDFSVCRPPSGAGILLTVALPFSGWRPHWAARVSGIDDRFLFKRQFIDVSSEDIRAESQSTDWELHIARPGVWEIGFNAPETGARHARYFVVTDDDAVEIDDETAFEIAEMWQQAEHHNSPAALNGATVRP